ncbi:hypothetical protein A2U01_0087375 [Trifolium medium]|uniref:Uncharacterized protein n=1 Tax=Trifolium medium TaxID=97028 RepID=A0A392TZX5_9FABA|nr:hypothetical protein [Trifolium medium]
MLWTSLQTKLPRTLLPALAKNFTSSSCQVVMLLGGIVYNQSFALPVKEYLNSLNLFADFDTFGGSV